MKVHSGHYRLIESLLEVFRSRMEIMNVLYVHPVAHHESLESPLAAKDIGHQPFVRVARDAVEFIVSSHQRQCSGIDSGLERREEDLANGTLRQVCRSSVGSIDRLAASHKMLDASQDIIRVHVALIAFHTLLTHTRYQIWILSESLAATAPTGVTGNFDIRIEGPVHVHGPHLKSGLTRNGVRHVSIE